MDIRPAEPLINLTALLRAVVCTVAIWLVPVIGATQGGYPGVVCMTPLAWVLTATAGYLYVDLARGQVGRRPGLAGALAGGLVGLIYGAIFVVVVYTTMAPSLEEANQTIAFSAGLTVGGLLIGAALGAGFARVALRARRPR